MSQTVITQMEEFDHEEVVFFQNKEVGLKAIVAIHNTTLGPALGGCRMWPYASEDEALQDVLRLSRGMTYKAAAAGLNLGGGKAVIIGDPKREKSQALFTCFGTFINTLGGRYITAEDVGTDVNDIEYMFTATDYVVGVETSHGGSGDPSPFTALGVFQGIQACLNRQFGDETLRGRTVVVQGVGNVGRNLVRMLVDAGAKVIVVEPRGEVTLEVPAAEWHATALALRDEFGFEQAVDLCGVDYLGYGSDEWDTADVSSQGFSRGVEGKAQGRFAWGEFPTEENGADGARPQHMPTQRFAVVAQLRSYQHNLMMHLRCFAPDEALPVVSSLTSVWPGLNWFEREAFDLYGVIFEGHPDLRRILTDYGFVGHPFRKDFPLIGNVEVRYDEEKKRVIYEPVTSVEPRVGVPRVIRDDARLQTAAGERAQEAVK